MSMKSYLRYEPAEAIGEICSPNCNAVFDHSGNLAITGCNQSVLVFNTRHGTRIATVKEDTSPGYPYDFKSVGASEVSVLCTSPDARSVAAGCSTGEVRFIDYHKGAITVPHK